MATITAKQKRDRERIQRIWNNIGEANGKIPAELALSATDWALLEALLNAQPDLL